MKWYICNEKNYVFADLRKFKSLKKLRSANHKSTNYKSANNKKDWVRNSQIRKMPQLQKVSKCNKSLKYANLPLQFAKLICGLPTFEKCTKLNQERNTSTPRGLMMFLFKILYGYWFLHSMIIFLAVFVFIIYIIIFKPGTLHHQYYSHSGSHKEMSSISALVYDPITGRRGGGVQGLSQWVQQCMWCPNKYWMSNSIFNLYGTTVLWRIRTVDA